MEESADVRAATPSTETERIVLEIWAEQLGCPVELDDDFFALGGDSIMATGVVYFVKELLGVELPAATVLEQATARRFSELVEAIAAEQAL